MMRSSATRAAIGIVCLSFIGCGSSPRLTSGRHQSGNADREFHMFEEGVASYYADEYNGRLTANGETYDMNRLTAAHNSLPFNTKVRVTNSRNKKSVVVRINDRGPFKDNRIIDLSLAAAKEIGLIAPGTAPVRLEVLELGDTSGPQKRTP